jgi:haloalkane dehalogenase
VRGLAFMEFIRPLPKWSDFHQQDRQDTARQTFRKFRTPGEGEAMILEANAFIERVLPGGILRKLGHAEMAAYRTPFPTPESRRPILALPRELPIEGEPADVDEALQSAHAALAASTYPKLLFVGEPGALVSPAFAERFAATLQHCAVAALGAGVHFLQEDHPEAIGRSVAGWIAGVEAATSERLRRVA